MSIERFLMMAKKGVNPPHPVPIGDTYGGGYYAGMIAANGGNIATHYLIVAPKATGEIHSILNTDTSITNWQTDYSLTGASSDIDGPSNGSKINWITYPASRFCQELTIGGYSDWYLPARAELEVLYYNLKPTTTNNDTSSGSNAYAVSPEPISTNYTTTKPAITSAAAFRSGGSDAFAVSDSTTIYWSSTERDNMRAYTQRFNDGTQSYWTKNYTFCDFYVRAVRRIAI